MIKSSKSFCVFKINGFKMRKYVKPGLSLSLFLSGSLELISVSPFFKKNLPNAYDRFNFLCELFLGYITCVCGPVCSSVFTKRVEGVILRSERRGLFTVKRMELFGGKNGK